MMRIAVLSDSHRARGRLFDIVERHLDNADLFIFLGDGEDDFDELVMLYPDLKYDRVSGNCDFYSSQPAYKEIIFDSKRIFFTHGHPFKVKYGYEMLIAEAQRRKADIVLFGHTHMQYTEYREGLCIMNPGSVRNGDYGIIDITPKGIMLIKEHI
jgi:hypothetical protein